MQETKNRHAGSSSSFGLVRATHSAGWLIPQFRHHIGGERETGYEREGQQLLRPTFEGIRDSVKELVGKQIDALACQFHAIHDMNAKEEIGRLAREYEARWRFVVK